MMNINLSLLHTYFCLSGMETWIHLFICLFIYFQFAAVLDSFLDHINSRMNANFVIIYFFQQKILHIMIV